MTTTAHLLPRAPLAARRQPTFGAPEQQTGWEYDETWRQPRRTPLNGHRSKAADSYSLGVMIMYLVTGRALRPESAEERKAERAAERATERAAGNATERAAEPADESAAEPAAENEDESADEVEDDSAAQQFAAALSEVRTCSAVAIVLLCSLGLNAHFPNKESKQVAHAAHRAVFALEPAPYCTAPASFHRSPHDVHGRQYIIAPASPLQPAG